MKNSGQFAHVAVLTLCFAALLAASDAHASTPTYTAGAYNVRTTTAGSTTFNWKLFVPFHYDPAVPTPLIVAFGGSGSWGTDNTSQLTDGMGPTVTAQSQTFPAIVAFLQPGPSGIALNDGLDLLAPLAVAQISAELNVDPRRIYVTGVSGGGWGAFEVAYNNHYAALLIGSSCVNNFRINNNSRLVPTIALSPNDIPEASRQVALVNLQLPVLHWEDSTDTTHPAGFADARQTAAAFQALVGSQQYIYNEFSRGGHVANYQKMYADTHDVGGFAGPIAWLLGQRLPLPSFSTQPLNQTVAVGQTATFNVAASGVTTPTLQWQKSINGGSTWTNIAGATSAAYTTPATVTADNGSEYRCIATNSAGAATSNAATLTVNPANVSPSFTSQPVNQTVVAGQTATFTVAASGTPAPTFQWQKSTNGGSIWTNIASATSASYTTPATVTADNGSEYRCIATNSAGAATSNAATLTVNPANVSPSFTTQPVNQTVVAGQTATFTVAASGTPAPTFQWQKSTNGGSTWTNIASATSASYTTPATVTADNGSEYRCIATNSAGAATSNAATLTVNPANVSPSFTTQPVNQTVVAGQTATFTVAASGTPAPTFQWQKSTNGGVTFANIAGATVASYTTPATVITDNGAKFRCVATNSAGAANSNAATLTVNAANTPPVIVSAAFVTPNPATAGQSLAFSAAASDADGDPLTYSWAFGDSSSGSGASISHVYTAAGTYTAIVMVTDGRGGSATSSVTVTINSGVVAPSITTQPASVTVTAGQTATFSVVASGTAPLSYQWTRNGTNIAGATSSSYTTAATIIADNGATFAVTVSNFAGSIASNNAVLAVNPLNAALAAYWKLDEGSGTLASDSSGNGNTGTLLNGPAWTTGKFGNALSFDGANNVVSVPNNSSWNSNYSTYTVAFWIKVNEIKNYAAAVGVGNWSGHTLGIYTVGNAWSFEIATVGGPHSWTCAGTSPKLDYLTTPDNAFHHVALVLDIPSSRASLYSDGVLVATDKYVDGTMALGANSLYLGGFGDGNRLNCVLDNVLIYKRALDVTEISNLASGSTLLAADFTNGMTVSKLQGSAKFTGGGHDSCSITGVIASLPKLFDPTGKSLVVNIGGASVAFTLDANGRARSTQGTVALKLKPGIRNKTTKKLEFQGGKVVFSAKIQNGTWATVWGLDPNLSGSKPTNMAATIELDGNTYQATVAVALKSKAKNGARITK